MPNIDGGLGAEKRVLDDIPRLKCIKTFRFEQLHAFDGVAPAGLVDQGLDGFVVQTILLHPVGGTVTVI